jgi:hypothetical protein
MESGSIETKLFLHIIPLAGSHYLFAGRLAASPGHRLCQVAADTRVSTRIDPSVPQAEITFPGESRATLYFHLQQGVTSPIPWLPGTTYEAFAPRPIPIPPDELRALRASAGLDADGRPLPKPPMAPAAPPGGRFPWILALGAVALAALGLVAVLLLSRRKRGSK